MEAIETRACRKCGLEKPVDEFRKVRGGSHGHTCTTCFGKAVSLGHRPYGPEVDALSKDRKIQEWGS